MKRLNTPIKMFLVLVFSMVVGVILLYLVFLIPTDPIYKHVKDSIHVFEIENTYPIMDGKRAKILDNWTDALMLGNAAFDNTDADTLHKALNVYRPAYNDDNPTYSLIDYINGAEVERISIYPRYWHGYQVILKPLLFMTDYLGFRSINQIVLLTLSALILAAMYKFGQRKIMSPFLLTLLFLRPKAIAFSLQYSAVFYITLTATLVSLVWNQRLRKGQGYLFFFLILGIITSYLDLLTYPVITLGIPLTMWLIMQEDSFTKKKVIKIVQYSITWALGYFGMWAEKWLAASVLLQRNIFKDAISQAQFRVSGQISGEAFTRLEVVGRNLYYGFSEILIPSGIILLAICLFILWKYKMDFKTMCVHMIPYMLICLIPFTWYMVLRNHSYIHISFTYRALSVAVFSFLCMGAAAGDEGRRTDYKSRLHRIK